MLWGAGSVIRKIILINTVITTVSIGLLLGSCMQHLPIKTTKPVADTPVTPTRYIDNDQSVNTRLVISTNRIIKSSQDDVWDRIRSSKKLDPSITATHKSIQRQLKSYKNNQHFFDVMGSRSEPYLYYIVTELEKRNMPLYLALLPIVESGYRTDVTSSGKATGLWQIIPSTGKYLGLKQNWWYDGRRDVIASTQAALNYLQQLYDRFEDWPLALAAYNSGGGTVARAMKKNTKRGRPTDYWSLDLPPETRLYIPKLIALETIISSPALYGIKLALIPDKPAIRSVNTKGQIQFRKAAELASVDIKELKKLNAGNKRWATDPNGSHHLLMPIKSADRFVNAISILSDKERVKWQHHKIKSGESLWSIARKYEISLNLLKTTNHLKSDNLRIGKNLLIPAGSSSPYQSIVSDISETRSKIITAKDNKYRVKTGDSLWLIARRFDIHIQQIVEWNNIKKDQALKPGLELKIFLEKPILEAAAL